MRTTIDVPESLLRRAKAEAALRGLRLKDVVRDALERHLAASPLVDPIGSTPVEVQELGAGCVFPLVTGTTGLLMRELEAGAAQRLLDAEDAGRAVGSR